MENIIITVPQIPQLTIVPPAAGTKNHSELSCLDFASSGHTGFQKELTAEQLSNIEAVPGKADKTDVVISTSAVSDLAHNTQYRITIPFQDYGVYQLYFVFPIINMPSVFECSAYIAPVPLAPVIFTKDTEVSGEDYPISWFGDDCNENGVFTPQANTHYEISFKRVGTDSDNNPIIIARVGAWQ